MPADPIVAEVREIRERRALELGYDVRAIAADAKEREKSGRREVVSFSKTSRRDAE